MFHLSTNLAGYEVLACKYNLHIFNFILTLSPVPPSLTNIRNMTRVCMSFKPWWISKHQPDDTGTFPLNEDDNNRH